MTRRDARHDARLDTTVGVETPEGVLLALSPAGPVPRAVAWLLDLMIRVGAWLLLALAFALLGDAGGGLLLLAIFLLEWFYPVFFEVLNRGATPGKATLGLAVVESDGRPVGWASSTVRNFLRFADFLPFLYFTGLLSMLLTRRFQRLGDLAAGTLVVHRGKADPRARSATLPAAEPLAPPVALRPDEQHALVALATRHETLSLERLDELAALAPALTGTDTSRQRGRLLGMARFLAGDQQRPPPARGVTR